MKKNIKVLFNKGTYLLFLLVVVLFLFEILYRYQVIDFYAVQLNALNSTEELESQKKKILLIGDSFSARPLGYVADLRKNDTTSTIINSSIPGTGIRQHNLILKNRLQLVQPDEVIYQFYLGNDLTDIEHPINYSENSVIRNLYWFLADSFLGLQFLNNQLARIKSSLTKHHNSTKATISSKSSIINYNQRFTLRQTLKH